MDSAIGLQRVPTVVEIVDCSTGTSLDKNSASYEKWAALWANGDPLSVDERAAMFQDDDGQPVDVSEPDEDTVWDEEIKTQKKEMISDPDPVDTEQRLFRTFVDAEYAYMKYVHPQAMLDFERDVAGLVLNTCDPVCRLVFGWKSAADPNSAASEAKTADALSDPEQRRVARAVLREFHPDKNAARVGEAQHRFQLIQKWLSDGEYAKVEAIHRVLVAQGSEAAWCEAERQAHSSSGSDAWTAKCAEIERMKRSLWWLWRDPVSRRHYRSYYVTPEEFKTLLQQEVARLSKENDEIRGQVSRMREMFRTSSSDSDKSSIDSSG